MEVIPRVEIQAAEISFQDGWGSVLWYVYTESVSASAVKSPVSHHFIPWPPFYSVYPAVYVVSMCVNAIALQVFYRIHDLSLTLTTL